MHLATCRMVGVVLTTFLAVLLACNKQPEAAPSGPAAVSGTVAVSRISERVAISGIDTPVAISGIEVPVTISGIATPVEVAGAVNVGSVAQPIAISGIAAPVQLAGPVAVTAPQPLRLVTAESDPGQLLTSQVHSGLVDPTSGCAVAVDGPFVLTDLHVYDQHAWVSSGSYIDPNRGRVTAAASVSLTAVARWTVEIRPVEATRQGTSPILGATSGVTVGGARALTGARLVVRTGEQLVICLGKDDYGYFSLPATWSGFRPY